MEFLWIILKVLKGGSSEALRGHFGGIGEAQCEALALNIFLEA